MKIVLKPKCTFATTLLTSLVGLFLSVTAIAQQKISGIVKDAKTQQPLAFASVQIINSKAGVTTDIDGKFAIAVSDKDKEIKVSFLGYKTKIIPITATKLTILLDQNIKQLDDVILDNKTNPAHRIIDSFLLYKNLNNPTKYNTYQYNAYTKAGIAGEDYFWREVVDKIDSIQPKRDTIKLTPAQIEKLKSRMPKPLDSAGIAKKKIKDSLQKIQDYKDSISDQIIRKNYVVFTESYTQKYFKAPNRHKETVLATKFSGINEANFSFTSNNFQPFGMYDNFIVMIGNAYQSPLTNGCKTDYRFSLKDVILNGSDTTFIIQYQPKRKKNFIGLKGFIHINSKHWALENIYAQPNKDSSKLMSFKINQQYTLVNDKWFPKQLNTIINMRDRKNDSSMLYWDSKSYFTNIKINEPIANKVFDDVVLDYADDAGNKPDSNWNTFRQDTIDKKGASTYTAYSMIPDEAKKEFNKLPKIMEALALQAIPWGMVDVPINNILDVNQYEQVRLGFGIRTNPKFSKHITLASNVAYGFGDKSFKYGVSAGYIVSKKRSTSFTLSFKQDLEEPGFNPYFKQNNFLLTGQGFRSFIANKMDSTKQWQIAFTSKPFGNLQVDMWGKNEVRNQGQSDYAFKKDNATDFEQQFTNTEIGIGLKYTIGETYTMLGRAKVLKSLPTSQLMLVATKGLPNVLKGNLDYNKVGFQFNHSFRTRKFGETKWQLNGGQIFGNVPYSLLFNSLSARLEGERNRRFIIYTPGNFQTAGLYEFVSDKMLQFNWVQNFGSLFFTTKSNNFKPQFSLVNTVAYGWLSNKVVHKNLPIKTLEDGLYESGLVINDLYRLLYLKTFYLGFGVGVFYRYGANSLPQWQDNFSLKIATSISF